MSDLNNNKVNNNTDFSYTRAKGASSSALTGTSCATRFLLGALGVDFTQIGRENYIGKRKVGGRGKSWIMLGKIEK